MREIELTNPKFPPYYSEFPVFAVDLDWNPMALWNALRMGLSKELKNSFTYSDIPEELPVFLMVCQKRDNQMSQ